MKCFILKTQDDLSYELICEADLLPVTAEAQHPHESECVGAAASSSGGHAAVTASCLGRSQSTWFPEAAFAGSFFTLYVVWK